MIIFFTNAPHWRTLQGLVKSPYRKAPLKVRSYDWLFAQRGLRASMCIFTDFDRLRHFELVAAASAFRQLRAAGIRALNDPARCAQRAELLFRLHKAGVNGFSAYAASQDPRPARFPVFLKCETDHAQAFDELIPDQAALDAKLEAVRASGYPLRDMLVIEFANRELRAGVYERFTIYRIGDRMVPANRVMQDGPFVKYGTQGLATDAEHTAIAEEIFENPYAERLRPAFEIAGIEYGRADFGFDGERLSVFEINTNPHIGRRVRGASGRLQEAVAHSMRAIAEAVDALDGENHDVRFEYPRGTLVRQYRFGPRRLRQP